MTAARLASDGNVVSLSRLRRDPVARDVAVVVVLESIGVDGRLHVTDVSGTARSADWLEAGAEPVELHPGDRLLAVFVSGAPDPLVIGRIGRYARPAPSKRVCLEAGEMLSLRCGQSSLDLRADGKVMIRGEDVLVRARGTKRIKAGTVNIN